MTNLSEELYHHGVKGMKWGVRRTPEQLGHKRTAKALKKARVSNLNNWGSSPSSNVLYVIGYSGSGKSTIAKELSD